MTAAAQTLPDLEKIPPDLEVIQPQPGPQTQFFKTRADIIIYGGAAGGGKTWALLLSVIKFYQVPKFRGIIFRRSSTQIDNPGGLWDESVDLFSKTKGAKANASTHDWRWPQYASRLKFGHLQHEKNKHDHQGGQYAMVGFDELTHFTRSQFFYLITRMRTMTGLSPIVRATTNPDSESWVAEFIAWWIDQTTGYAIPERSGQVRWFVVIDDTVHWADSKSELVENFAPVDFHDDPDNIKNPIRPKSMTFIAAKLEDNQKLMESDPGYLGNLLAQSKIDRERLKEGNWLIRPSAGQFFQRYFFEVVKSAAARVKRRIRFWDQAATKPTPQNPDPDYTVGLLLSEDYDGVFYVEHVIRFREEPHQVLKAMKNAASSDGKKVEVGFFQDPGQAGKAQARYQTRQFAGYIVQTLVASKDKQTMAKPVSSQAEAGNIKVVEGDWNEEFFKELENFPTGSHDDQVDPLSGGFQTLTEKSSGVAGKTRRQKR